MSLLRLKSKNELLCNIIMAMIGAKISVRVKRQDVTPSIIAPKSKPEIKAKPKPEIKAKPIKAKARPNPKFVEAEIADADSEEQSEDKEDIEEDSAISRQLRSDTESDVSSDMASNIDPPDSNELYMRWINGVQLLISMDNRRIYHPITRKQIATVTDGSNIVWI